MKQSSGARTIRNTRRDQIVKTLFHLVRGQASRGGAFCYIPPPRSR